MVEFLYTELLVLLMSKRIKFADIYRICNYFFSDIDQSNLSYTVNYIYLYLFNSLSWGTGNPVGGSAVSKTT